MTKSSRTLITLAISAVAVAGLTGCGAASATPTASPSAAPATTTPTATPAATGCAATPGVTMPAGAVSKSTIDVDGDDAKDTEWIVRTDSAIEFGVTTASGATFSYDVTSASPGAPGGFVSALTDTQTLSMLSDGRVGYVHALVNCEFVQPMNAQNAPYTFDLQDLYGNGTGVGCDNGDLVGYLATPTGDSYTVAETVIDLTADGAQARNGKTTELGTNLAATDSIVTTATSVTCGVDTIAGSGVLLSE